MSTYLDDLPLLESDGENATMWRYMEFWKFESLMKKNALFFNSLKNMKKHDPLEGTWPHKNVERRRQLLEEQIDGVASETLPEVIGVYEQAWSYALEFGGEYTMVNCWHKNPYESPQMWESYVPSGYGVAIRSRIKRLKESFNPPLKITHYISHTEIPASVYLYQVAYNNYYTERIAEDSLLAPFQPFIHKHKEKFEYEKELRAMVSLIPHRFGLGEHFRNYVTEDEIPLPFKELNEYGGIFVPVDLQMLIDTIVVSPSATIEVFRKTEILLHESNLNKEVLPSALHP